MESNLYNIVYTDELKSLQDESLHMFYEYEKTNKRSCNYVYDHFKRKYKTDFDVFLATGEQSKEEIDRKILLFVIEEGIAI